MAGIGWKLEALIDRDSPGSTLGVFLTGAAVTSGPWLLTTLVLVLMQLGAASGGVAMVEAQGVITVVYASVIVIGAPVDIVLSRYTADRVYQDRSDQIAAPLRRTLAGCLVGFTVLGPALMWLAGAPRAMILPGTVLTAIVAGQWLLLSAAGGLSSPGLILRAFALGSAVCLAGALLLSRADVLGAAGYLYGFGAGQLVTFAVLLWGTLRALPPDEDEGARILPAFRDYWLLGVAAFASHASLWIDKVMVLVLAGGAAAAGYATMAAVAWLSVVPACAYLFVMIETVFYRRFEAFYAALARGVSLPELDARADALRVEVDRVLLGVVGVQGVVCVISLAAAPRIVDGLGLTGGVELLCWLIAGAMLQVIALTATLLLYYFDVRGGALATASTQLVAAAVLTWVVGPGVGYALACALACALGIPLLRRRMRGLVGHTFTSQPFPAEE
jgi:uncharacterized membrane protein